MEFCTCSLREVLYMLCLRGLQQGIKKSLNKSLVIIAINNGEVGKGFGASTIHKDLYSLGYIKRMTYLVENKFIGFIQCIFKLTCDTFVGKTIYARYQVILYSQNIKFNLGFKKRLILLYIYYFSYNLKTFISTNMASF